MNFLLRVLQTNDVDKLEHKSIPLSVDDLSKDKRTAVFAHATYDNIDRVGDICRPGMFDKSWKENKSGIKLMVDHKPGKRPGIVEDVWESKSQAFTKAKFGNYTLGNDTLEMLEMGIIDTASFGFKAVKANKMEVKGKKVRELKEVFHPESTLVYETEAINPESKVVLVTKSLEALEMELKALSADEQSLLKTLINGSHSNMEAAVNFSKTIDPKSDLYSWVSDYIANQAYSIGGMRDRIRWGTQDMKSMQARAEKLEKFCRESNASDECIQTILQEAKALNNIVSQFDTANTHDDEPGVSEGGNANDGDVLARLQLLNLKMSMS